MTTRRFLLTILMTLAASPGVEVQQAAAPLDAALAALGASTMSSLQVTGHGFDYVVGQPYDGNVPWPRFNMPSFTMAVDYGLPAMRTERVRAQGEDPPRGGALQPLVGEQRLVQVVSGRFAWNEIGGRPVSAGTGAAVRGESPGVGLHTRTALEERLLQIWLTPPGFIKAAIANNASVRSATIRGAKKTIVSFTTPIDLRLEGVLNEQHLLERVETWFGHPVLGDTMIEAVYSDYQDFGSLKFPSRIVFREGGYPAFELTVTAATANAGAAFDVPPSIRDAAPAAAPPPIVPQQMSPGVWLLPGGTQSVVVEFRNHLVVLDAPVDEERSLLSLDAIRTLSPKPIRYVVNTHLHFDHVGGLRTYAAEGATIVTQRDNIPYLQQVLNQPRTIRPDRFSKSGRTIAFEGVVGTRTFSDTTRHLVLYHYAGNNHGAGMLMAYLPKERILFEADSYIPGRPGAVHPAIPNLIQFYEAVRRLGLDVEQILPSHGQVATMQEFRETVERSRAGR